MVRDASRRKQKYEGKIDADVMRSRILALKDSMVEQVESKYADLATMESEVKKVVEGQTTAVYAHLIPFYLNVGRELYRLSKKFTGITFTKESNEVCKKWKNRGLDQYIINAIAKLFGHTPSYT